MPAPSVWNERVRVCGIPSRLPGSPAGAAQRRPGMRGRLPGTGVGGVPRSSASVAGQTAVELVARGDGGLGEDLVQVAFDRAWAPHAGVPTRDPTDANMPVQ